MAPPESIQNSNASYGVCLPDGSVQGVEILVSTDASQQSGGAEAIVVGVQNYSEGISYVRPAVVTRQPTNVFQAMPLQGAHKKAAIALGDALQTLINDRLANGEAVDPRLETIAQTLHEGKLPDLDDPDIADLFNQSFSDTALDAVVHSIGLQSNSPNRSLHAQALHYSLPYYLQQSSNNPADDTIRQGLVTALSNSGPEGRQVLVEAGRNASPATQQQIQAALQSTPVVNTTHATNVSVTPINAGGSTPNSSTLRLAAATQLGAVSTLSVSALSFSSFAAPSTLSSLMIASANLGAPEVIANVLLRSNFSPVLAGSSLNLSSGTNPGLTFTSFSPVASGASLNAAEGLTTLSANAVVSNFIPNANLQPPNLNNSDISNPANHNPVIIAIRQELQSLGFSGSAIQSILNNAPSPLLMGYVAIQAGVHQSLTQQSTSFIPVFNPRTVENGAYRVAAINRTEGGSDREGFGSSREDSSGGGQGERQGSSGQGNPDQENPQNQNPADIYTSNLA